MPTGLTGQKLGAFFALDQTASKPADSITGLSLHIHTGERMP